MIYVFWCWLTQTAGKAAFKWVWCLFAFLELLVLVPQERIFGSNRSNVLLLLLKQLYWSTEENWTITKYKAKMVNFSFTHTHPCECNGPFSGTSQVSRHQKGKTNLDFTKARASE